MASKTAYIKDLDADIEYPDTMDEAAAIAKAMEHYTQRGSEADDFVRNLGFEVAPPAPKESPKTNISDRLSSLLQAAKPDMSGVQALAHGVSQNLIPGMDILQSSVVSPIQQLAKQINPEFVPASEQMQQSAQQHPIVSGVGEAVPDIARSIAAFGPAKALMGTTEALPEGASILSKLLKVGEIGGKGAAAGVTAGQFAAPSANPIKILLDALIPGGMEVGSAGISKLASKAGPMAEKIWERVLPKPFSERLQEIKTGEKTLPQQLVEKRITGDPSSLVEKAKANIEHLGARVDDIVSNIKGKIRPLEVLDRLNALKSEYMGQGESALVGSGERAVAKIDEMINKFSTMMKSEGWPNAVKANEMKRKYWSIAKKVFTQDQNIVEKEAEAAIGSGLREGIEKQASKTIPGMGEELGDINSQLGFWLDLKNSAQRSQALSSGPSGGLPLSRTGAITRILDELMGDPRKISMLTKLMDISKQGSTLDKLSKFAPGAFTGLNAAVEK